ncbi:hypothetical protein DOY81_011339 [Sarcophaga bullata]|nr:hypothetical protein DOY81_011339 [Sarcophaga bullata]
MVASKDDDLLSDLTRELLRKIDNLEEEDCKSKARHEPNNYCYQQQDHDNNDSATTTTNNNTAGLNNGLPEEPYELFERRKDLKNEDGELFTRRTDSKSEYEHKEAAVIEKNKTVNKTDTLPKNSAEIKNDDEVVVNSLIEENHKKPYSNKTIEIISLDSGSEDESCNDKPSTSKAAVAALKAQINSDKQTHLSEITNSAAKTTVEASPGTENCITEKKLKVLCDTIESAFSGQINLNELLDEIQSNQSNVEDKANKNDCSDDLMAISNKENHNIQPAKEISSQSIKDTEDFSKILQNALSNIDFQQISIAISHVKSNMIGNNASNANSSESPPPPAPPISRNVITTLPLNTALQQQQPQHQMTHIMYPNVIGQPPFQSFCHVPYIPMPAQQLITPTYNPIQNVPQIIPPRPTVNIKDPRIQKQLQAIQKSPLINCNLINPLVADSIMNICRSNADQQMPKPSHQQQQQNILSNKTSAEGVVVERNRRKSTSETTASAISYGEYKRRKLEKLLEAERLREQEKAAKLEKLKADEVRSKIISTLNPCKDQITSLWSRHKTVVTNTIHHRDCDSEVGEEAVVRNDENLLEKSNTSSSPSNNSENKTISPSESKEKKQRDKRRRLDLNLRCTVKGFDQVECFQHLKERRSSIQAREHIRQQLNVDRFEDTTSERISLADMPETVSPTRRLSVPAHPTITDQPSGSQRKEIHGDHPHQPIGSKRCYPQFTGIDSPLDLTGNNCSTGAPTLKRRKTIDEIHKPKNRCRSLRLEDSSSNSDDGDDDNESFEKLKKLKETVIKNPGYVKLERISREFIRKHTKSKDIEMHTKSFRRPSSPIYY